MVTQRLVAGFACLCALAACSSTGPSACRAGESPLLVVRLVPTGVSATPEDVHGGGSLTMAVALPSGQPVASLQVSPKGPLGQSGLGDQAVRVRRSGRTTVTATDARGARFARVVVVHC